jgi:putative transcriptional regulator
MALVICNRQRWGALCLKPAELIIQTGTQAILVILPSLLDILDFFYIISIRMAPMEKVQLGNRLKVARAEKNLSQEELANMVGVTRQTISSIETRQYTPSALLAFVIAKKLEKTVEELFFLEGDER